MGLILANMLPASVVKAATPAQSEGSETPLEADAYAIYPIPQSITYADGEFQLSDSVTIVAEAGVDSYTVAFLEKVLTAYDVSYTKADAVKAGTTNILLGVKGSTGVADAYVTSKITVKDAELFTKNDAYVLDASKDAIVILGKDTDSAYYGVATLQMMFSSFDGEKFLNAHIEDYATVATRGYIEGFYGAWDFEERENLMRFAGNYKMNSYVYAAKGDNYHTSKWADLYPADMLAEFENLVRVGNETKVKFAWSVHLGTFFGRFSEADVDGNTATFTENYNKLIAKFKQLYDIGVRKFDILNDDFGSGSHTMVVKVLNRINADLKEMGCESIVYCPQGYNKAWAGNGAELEALKLLDDDIALYWTGDDVNTPITQSTVDYVTEKSGHKPDFWLNYPVNEHAKSGIFLGDITYYARDNVSGLTGFHSNPCKYAYANEVGLYQLAALVWNNSNYSQYAQEVWLSAFDYLQPEVEESYRTIARNVSNAPNSGRVGDGFPESNYLKEKLENVQALVETGAKIKENEEAQAVYAEFKNILAAIADFRENCANQDLVAELDPWLKSLSDIATAGRDALESLFAMEEGNASKGWEKLSSASKCYDSTYTYIVDPDLPTTVAKAGSKRLSPFVSKMISVAKNKLTPILNPDDDTVTPVLFAKMGGEDRAEDDNAKKMYDGDEATYASWSIVQQTGDYFGLDLGRVITVRDIAIMQGKDDTHHDFFHKATLQYSADKETWTDIEANVELDGHKITVDGLDIKARYIRYYLNEAGYNGKPDYWTHVREFTVNKKVPEYDRVYTNVAALAQTPLTIEGAKVSVRDLKNLTLQAGQYVGIKLVKPVAVTEFTKELSNENGLTLEYSYNGQDWTTAGSVEDVVGVKYLRLINQTEAAVTTDLQKIEMNIKYLKAEPTLKISTVSNGFSEGKFENIFDGDLSTYALTGSAQAKDTFFTFDLGKMIEVYDVTTVTTDGAQRFYNAKIQISKDNVTWTDIIEVANDSSEFIVPYRYAYGDAQGAQARYLRVYFTGSNGNALKLHEIQINKNVAAGNAVDEIVSSMAGNLQAAMDKDISTLLATNAKAGDYIEYRISANTNITQVSILQGAAGTGKAIAVTANGNVELGVLNQSVNTFDTTEIAPITAIRIEWAGEEQVTIHEISVSGGKEISDDIGTYVEPIIVNGTVEISNIALGKEVTVSGTSDGNKDKVNDGDKSTKWDSNAIKNGSGADIGDAWLCINLGGSTYEINQVVVSYFNKIYPTSYELQVSDDGEEWTTVKTLTKNNNGSTYPIDTIDFETAVSAKYVRLYFNTVNTAAAGNGIGVQEFEIYGKEVREEPEVPHEHTYGEWKEVKAATCKEAGKEERTCSVCGEKETQEIAKLTTHKAGAWEVIKEAACEVAGSKVQKCTECGEVIKTEAIPALEHKVDAGVITKEPTSKEKGTKTYSCTVCKKVIKTEELPKLEKPEEPQKPKLPKKGAKIVIKNITYKVTKAGAKNGTVAFVKAKSNAKTITIPATIKKDGVTYKVTVIEKEAFKNQKKLTKVTIGANVSKIGANVFKNCKKLKTIIITSKKLTAKTLDKTAFKGVNKKATLRVPSGKINTYKRILKTKGLNSKVKIKK